MILKPGVETFSPTNLSTNNALDGVIQIGYNQPIQFSGIGTITIRAGAVDGTIHEEFTCGVSTRASMLETYLPLIQQLTMTLEKHILFLFLTRYCKYIRWFCIIYYWISVYMSSN